MILLPIALFTLCAMGLVIHALPTLHDLLDAACAPGIHPLTRAVRYVVLAIASILYFAVVGGLAWLVNRLLEYI